MQAPVTCLDYLIDRKIQFFVLSLESTAHRAIDLNYYLPNAEIKYYNVMIDGQNFFDQPVKNNLRTKEFNKIQVKM